MLQMCVLALGFYLHRGHIFLCVLFLGFGLFIFGGGVAWVLCVCFCFLIRCHIYFRAGRMYV